MLVIKFNIESYDTVVIFTQYCINLFQFKEPKSNDPNAKRLVGKWIYKSL
jgi:hypothetical protein